MNGSTMRGDDAGTFAESGYYRVEIKFHIYGGFAGLAFVDLLRGMIYRLARKLVGLDP
jgi:hypothetical protein